MTNKVVIGERFGKWTVIEDAGMNGKVGRHVRCRCECGRESVRALTGLKSGRYASCRCALSPVSVQVGERFGRWLVVRQDGEDHYERAKFQKLWCRCDCGTERSVIAGSLRRGRSVSCGCYHQEVAGDLARTHNATSSGMYHVWVGMHQRCYDPRHKAYKDYGAKGIKVCDRWHDVKNFVVDMGKRPPKTTIDRMDATKDYAPENCRWATGKQQIRHRNITLMVEHNGVEVPFAEVLETNGIEFSTEDMRAYRRAAGRLRCGWTLERIVSTARNEKGGGA